MKNRTWSIPLTSVAVLLCVPFIYPFIFLVLTALKPLEEFQTDKVGVPQSLTLDNLAEAWGTAQLGDAIWHSAIAVSVSVTVTIVAAAAAAFWFFSNPGRSSTTLRYALIAAMVVPAPVYIIPLFLQLGTVGLTDNLPVLGMVYAATNIPFGIYLIYVFYQGLPAELFEAARVDGASMGQQFRKIAWPLARPVVATLAVLTFLWSWSDLLVSLVLVQDPDKRTITVATALLNDQYNTDTPTQAAGLLIALIPVLLMFLFGQRYLAKGIAAGVGR